VNLHANIKNFLVKGTYDKSKVIMDAQTYVSTTNSKKLNAVKILFTTEPLEVWTAKDQKKIETFVKNGGGLFVASCPWGWAQLKDSSDFHLMLAYKTLLAAGIAFTGNAIFGSDTFNFNALKVTDASHFGIQVDVAISPEKTGYNYDDTVKVLGRVDQLDPYIVTGFYKRVNSALILDQIQSIAPTESNPINSAYLKAKIICYQKFILDRIPNIAAPGH
jgi:hypothetical protein